MATYITLRFEVRFEVASGVARLPPCAKDVLCPHPWVLDIILVLFVYKKIACDWGTALTSTNSLCMSNIMSTATPAGCWIFHKPDPALEQ